MWLAALSLSCVPRAAVPDFGAPEGQPVWPPPPEVPRVEYVGEVSVPGGFARPIDVACGRDHRLAVADPDAGLVWLLDLDSRRISTLHHAGGEPLLTPVGVSYQDDGRLLVVDADRAAIYRTVEGRQRLEELYQGPPLTRPTAAIGLESGALLVVDAGGHVLFRMSLEQGSLALLAGDRGRVGAGFNFPVDAALAPDGTLYVADSLNAAVQSVRSEGLAFVAGGPGYGGGFMVRPKGVTVDVMGRLHVVDGGMQHVMVVSPDGALLGYYGSPGEGPGELSLPAGICIDEHHHVFVADTLNHRVQVYALTELVSP